MATNQMKADVIDDVLYLSNSRHSIDLTSHYGYKTGYLEEQLSPIEESFLICENCKGLARNPCLKGGSISCYTCMRDSRRSLPVDQSRQTINKLKICCPLLRDCEWKGVMEEGATHLKECECLRIMCPLGCGIAFQRCEMAKHTEEDCPMHGIKCRFCEVTILYKEVAEHEEVCLYQPIKCECGGVFRRNTLAKHIGDDCPLTKVECPYSKYSCKIGGVRRKDMIEHKQKFYIEHQDMLEEENFRLKMELISLNTKMKFKRDMNNVELTVSEPFDVENEIEGPVFTSGISKFTCYVNTGEKLTIGINKARGLGLSRDPATTNFHLLLSSESNELDLYHEENSIVNNDVGRLTTPLFALSKEVYSKYIRGDSLFIKIFYE